jgi:hypothetical protein
MDFDASAYLRAIEKAWQDRDGRVAADFYTDDAVMFFADGQRRSGAALRAWPQAWFDFATDLRITKHLRAYSDGCLADEWESRYTHPVTGKTMLERGAEFFWIRDGKVYLHHMFEHTWAEGENTDATWPAV